MILTCPACGTSYTVQDGAIPAQGRQVRCASCKHSWHQDGDAAGIEAPVVPPVQHPVQPAPVAVREPVSASPEASAVGEPTKEPASPAMTATPNDAALTRAAVAPPAPDSGTSNPNVAATAEPYDPTAATAATVGTNDFTSWIEEEDEVAQPPRRKGPWLILLAIVIIAALAAAAWFFAPREWMARAGLREAAGNSPLKLMVTSQDRQKLASGNDLVSLSGRVINPTEETLSVPPLQADLRDGGGKLVYSWTIAPPAPRLPPRGSATFNAAELGVPPNATSLTLRWAS